MYQLFRSATAFIALCASLPAAAKEQSTAPITPYADIRYRLEIVDQQGLPEEATASTLRIRAGVRTREWHGLSGVVEGEAIAAIGSRNYNDTVNGKAAYPVVADPTDVLLNQAYLRWRPAAVFEVTAGRQAVNIDNQRWIGSVNWRQNDQTLDAARVSVKPVKALAIEYVHAWRVNRVFGPDSPQGIWRGTAIDAARVAYTIKNIGTLSAYGYWLDVPSLTANSSRTLGVRMAGEHPVGGTTRLLYSAEFARQHDFAGNPRKFSHDYALLEGGLGAGPVTAKIGLERLSGDGTTALQTPLATLHAFNGWADKFLTTPANGLRDIYADASYKVSGKSPAKGLLLRAAWHDYRSTRAGIHYGTEWNAIAAYPVGRNVTLTAKAAFYKADAFATDTTKIWLMAEARL